MHYNNERGKSFARARARNSICTSRAAAQFVCVAPRDLRVARLFAAPPRKPTGAPGGGCNGGGGGADSISSGGGGDLLRLSCRPIVCARMRCDFCAFVAQVRCALLSSERLRENVKKNCATENGHENGDESKNVNVDANVVNTNANANTTKFRARAQQRICALPKVSFIVWFLS